LDACDTPYGSNNKKNDAFFNTAGKESYKSAAIGMEQ
jgi:hypothetical protein